MIGDQTEIKSISEGGRLYIENVLPLVDGKKMKRNRCRTNFLSVSLSESKTRRMKKRKLQHKNSSVSAELSKGVQHKNSSVSAELSKGAKTSYQEKEKNVMM